MTKNIKKPVETPIKEPNDKIEYEATCDFPCYDENLEKGGKIMLTERKAQAYLDNYQLELAK